MDGTVRGTESWYDDGLMVRKTDMGFLIKHMQMLGMKLVDRTPCQFTESYTNVPTKFLKRAIYAFNTFYLQAELSCSDWLWGMFSISRNLNNCSTE